MSRVAFALLLSTVALASAAAQSTGTPPDKGGKQPPSQRYSFTHVDGNVLRLDGETGQVTACRQQSGAWMCGAVAEESAQTRTENEKMKEQVAALQAQLATPAERAALKGEIDRLQADNAALKNSLAALEQRIAGLQKEVLAQDERDKQRADIARLSAENNALTETLASLQAETVALRRQVAQLSAPAEKDRPRAESKLLTREDVEHARAVLLDAWRRVVETIKDLHKDMMGKG